MLGANVIVDLLEMFRAVQRCGSGHGGGGLKLSSVILELFSNLTKKKQFKGL